MRNSLKGVKKSRDVYDTLGPLYFLTLLVGISPFKWTSHKYQSSKIAVIYSFTLLISFLAAYNFRVSYKREEEKFSISSLSDKIKTYSNNSLATLLIVMSYWKSKDIIDLTKQIADFDEIIAKQVLQKIDYVTSKLLISGYSIFVIIMSAILEYFYCSMSLVQRIVYSNTCLTYCYFSIILSATLEFQFITYVLIIQDRFKLINKQLQNLHAENESIVEPTNSVATDQNADLRILQQCHIRLSELCKYINDLFSFQMLACITLLFVHIMIYIVQAIHKYLMNEIDAHMTIFIAYIIYYLIRLLLITKSCDSTINEGKKTGHLLHGVDSILDDEVITNEVLVFSKQLIHNKLKFTAYGFFTIDMTLFFTVIAAIVTYLLVLIQMNIPFSASIIKNNTSY